MMMIVIVNYVTLLKCLVFFKVKVNDSIIANENFKDERQQTGKKSSNDLMNIKTIDPVGLLSGVGGGGGTP